METAGTTWDLAHLLTVLRRRVWWILPVPVVAVAVAVALSMAETPVYHAEAHVLIEREVAQTSPDALGRVFFGDQELMTQVRLIHSDVIATRVADALSLELPEAGLLNRVSVGLLPSSRVVRIVAADVDPTRAAQLAQAFADEYLDYRREAALDTTEFAAGDGGQVIRTAAVPTHPVGQSPVRSAVAALVLGLGIGLLLALAREVLDRRVRTVADAVEAADRPALGRVPLIADDQGGHLPMLRHASGPPAEAFRDLRTNLRFVGQRGAPSSVLVTSALRGEGKSLVAANLALAAAAAGQDVVLVDADLRRPAIARMLGVDRGPGLTSVLSGDMSLDQVLLEFENQDGLSVLPSGPTTPLPNELLGSAGMASLLERLTSRFELVVIDAPPVLVVPDPLELTTAADVTLLVVELKQSTRQEITEACDRLGRVGGHVAGLVINRADHDPRAYGYDSYDDSAA